MAPLLLETAPMLVVVVGSLLAALASCGSVTLQASSANIPVSWIVLGAALALSTYLYGKLPHWQINTLSGPKPKWLLGNLLDVKKAGGLPEAMANWRKIYGPMYKYYVGRRLVVVVTDVEIVKDVTLRKFKVFHDRPLPSHVTKHSMKGLVFNKGTDWNIARNTLQPLFHKGMLHGFLPVVSNVCADLVACLSCVPPSVPVDANEMLHKMAMDVIGQVALGVRFGLLKEERKQLAEFLAHSAAALGKRGGYKGGGDKPLAGASGLTHRNVASKGMAADAVEKLADGGSTGQGSKAGGSASRLVTNKGGNGADAIVRYQTKQTIWSGKVESSRDMYDLVMESMKLSSSSATVSNFVMLLCKPLGQAMRFVLSRVPGTADHRYGHIQAHRMQSMATICTARKQGGSAASGGLSLGLAPVALTAASGGAAEGSGTKGANPAASPASGASRTEMEVGAKDALSFLLSAVNKDTKQPFSTDSVAALAKELISAGSDTTANTLAFAIYCVSGDPAVEARVVAEVTAAGRGSGAPLSHEDLEDKFPYVEAVIKESLRMYPPVNGMQREALEDVDLGGHHVPAGTIVMVPAMAMNRDPDVHVNPDTFWPDRFLTDAKPDYAFQFNPFGVGPRMCVGNRFAMMEVMLVFIRLYQNFSFARAPPTDAEMPLKLLHTVVTKPKNGVWVYVQARNASTLSE